MVNELYRVKQLMGVSPVAQQVKNPPTMQETEET